MITQHKVHVKMHFYLFGLDFLCVLQYNKREVIIMYGQNIRLFRKQKGMNQHELGAAMDVSAVSVSKWEREQTQPDIETLQKLADLFDTSIDELCGRPPKPEDAMDNMSVMCRAFRQMKPEEQEKYLAVGKALFASAFAPAAPAQDDDAAE